MEAASLRATQAQAAASVASQKASAYLSGWGAWASEKRKGWGRTASTADLKEKAQTTPSAAVSEERSHKNEKGLTVSTGGESQYGEAGTPEGPQTVWEADNNTPGESVTSPKSPGLSLKSPRRLKRMSTRLSNKSPKSKERIVDGIGRIDT